MDIISNLKIKNSFNYIYLDIPPDRNAEFDLQLIKKYENVCTELDKTIISLYIKTKGMSILNIQANIKYLYGITILP